MQVFIATVEESSQQRQRTPAPLDQYGLRGCPDPRVVGHHAIFPLNHLGRVPGLISQSLNWLVHRMRGLSEHRYSQSTQHETNKNKPDAEKDRWPPFSSHRLLPLAF